MKFPKCLTEAETLERAIAGANLARYGDGEFNICMGRNCISQRFDKGLAAEMRAILEKAPNGCLPCLPDPYGGTPKKANWQKYENWDLKIGAQEFGSAFISRPDSAPWIDTQAYWQRMRDIWLGKDVTLVMGSARSLRTGMMEDAASVREIWGTYRDAYNSVGLPPDHRNHQAALKTIDALMDAIGKPAGPVLLCLGPTATAMAARLAKIGVHGIDLGHLGMYMRHAGSYRFKADDLMSPAYRELCAKQRAANPGWGSDGGKHAKAVAEFSDELGAVAILDYGAGTGALSRALPEFSPKRVVGYEPGVDGPFGMPKPMDLTVCSDVLEHVEPDKLDNVLTHIHCVTALGAYVTIATRPANAVLADGRNAHLTVQSPKWWLDKIAAKGWKHARPPVIKEGHDITLWLVK